MRFLDALLGRNRPKPSQLDALFALPAAAVGIEAATGLRPSGAAAVAVKPVSGQGFDAAERELRELLALSAEQSDSELGEAEDRYGYRWVTVRDPDLEDLVATVHVINRVLTDHGFGPRLLCSVFAFASPQAEERRLYLIYLYKRGTFYPFVPGDAQRRDNELELQLRGVLGQELPLEQDLSRWFPVWGVPVR